METSILVKIIMRLIQPISAANFKLFTIQFLGATMDTLARRTFFDDDDYDDE